MIKVSSALERKNKDLIEDSIRQVKADYKRRDDEVNAEIEDACKDAAGFIARRGRGVQTFAMADLPGVWPQVRRRDA